MFVFFLRGWMDSLSAVFDDSVQPFSLSGFFLHTKYVYCSLCKYSSAISCPSTNFKMTEQFHSISRFPSLSATIAHVQQRRVPPPSITLRLVKRRMLIKTGKWPFGPGDEARSVSAEFWDWLALPNPTQNFVKEFEVAGHASGKGRDLEACRQAYFEMLGGFKLNSSELFCG